MDMPLIKSRNFTSHEIGILRAEVIKDITLDDLYIMGFVHGSLQQLRTSLEKHFGKRFGGLTVISSNRRKYNSTIPGASSTSYHIWKIQTDRQIRCAVDIKPVGIGFKELYQFMCANCMGEIKWEKSPEHIHWGIVGMENEQWIQP